MPDLTEQETRQERIVRIDQMLADIDRIFADRDRKRQEMKFAPWQIAFAGMTAGAALFAAGGVFVKLLIP